MVDELLSDSVLFATMLDMPAGMVIHDEDFEDSNQNDITYPSMHLLVDGGEEEEEDVAVSVEMHSAPEENIAIDQGLRSVAVSSVLGPTMIPFSVIQGDKAESIDDMMLGRFDRAVNSWASNIGSCLGEWIFKENSRRKQRRRIIWFLDATLIDQQGRMALQPVSYTIGKFDYDKRDG